MDANIQLTSQQAAFVSALLTTTANIALRARAGTGKSSTILVGVDELVKAHPRIEILICAFNKAIEVEMSEKLKARKYDWRQVQASTAHALGWGLVRFAFRLDKSAIDDNKVRNIVDSYNHPIAEQYRNQICELVSKAKGEGVGFFDDRPVASHNTWFDIADHYDINGLDDTSEMEQVVDTAIQAYKQSLAQTNIIDFDDMILFPLVKNLRVKFTKDIVFVDEAQDLSRARQALVAKFVKPGTGRMVVVGDDRQAIYGFAGADSDALENMIERWGCVDLPLSVTWRCPKAVVAKAQTIVPDIEAAPNAAEGEVVTLDELPKDLSAKDAILCRNTAPLIETAFMLIRSGTPCKVEGRAIGEGLVKLASRWKIKTIDALLNRLEEYKEREVQKAMAKGSEAKAEQVADKVATLVTICEACLARDEKEVRHVVVAIRNLFEDNPEKVLTLATYHRSKGREWQRVILLRHAELCPAKFARQPHQVKQEHNLAYVAFTRAQATLAFLG